MFRFFSRLFSESKSTPPRRSIGLEALETRESPASLSQAQLASLFRIQEISHETYKNRAALSSRVSSYRDYLF